MKEIKIFVLIVLITLVSSQALQAQDTNRRPVTLPEISIVTPT